MRGKTIFLEYFFLMIVARPLPVSKPTLAHISWITTIKGIRYNAVHSIPSPNFAPAWANVAILDGSSSAVPVISPGPKDLRKDFIDILFELLYLQIIYLNRKKTCR